MWYAEQRNIFGRYAPITSANYPIDINSEGQKYDYRIRVEVASEHRHLGLVELQEIYGTKAEIAFKSVRNLAA